MKSSISELSKMTGQDRRTVTQRLADLPFEAGPGRAKLYSTREALLRLFGGGGPDGERLDPQQERARRDKAQADLAELKLKRERGDLLAVEDVQQELLQDISIARSRWLSMPSRLAPELAPLSDIRQIEDRIRDEVHAVLHEYAQALASLTASK